MIYYNENPEKKVDKKIKHKCKINSAYYSIQIYTNSSQIFKTITFLIKSSTNHNNSVLFKREFSYDELLRYNKYFKYFSSFENIFTNISQSILENKFTISNNIKYLSLTMKLFIERKKQFANVNINLNKHKHLKSLSLPKNKRIKIHKETFGIKNEKELNNTIHDIKKRLKKLEKSQSQILMNNYNINNTNINSINTSNYNPQDENSNEFKNEIKNNNKNKISNNNLKNKSILKNKYKDSQNINDSSSNNNKSKAYYINTSNFIDNNIQENNLTNKNQDFNNKRENNINNYKYQEMNNQENNNNIDSNIDSNNNNFNQFNTKENNSNNIIKNTNNNKYQKFINRGKSNSINSSNNNINNENNNNYSNNNDYNNINNENSNNYINNNSLNGSNINNNDKFNKDENLNIDNLNKKNKKAQALIGINNILLEKLDNLETAIYNKDKKIKNLENRVSNLSKISRNQQSIRLKTKSDIYNYNKLSSFYHNQNTRDLDKSNVISSINKTKDEQEQKYNLPNRRNKFVEEYTQTNNDDSYFYDNTKLNNKKYRGRKKNNSFDNSNYRKINNSISESKNEDSNQDIKNDNTHRKHRKRKPHSVEKYQKENELRNEKRNWIKKSHSIEKPHKKYSIKVKGIKKLPLDQIKNNNKDNSSVDLENNNNIKFINKNNGKLSKENISNQESESSFSKKYNNNIDDNESLSSSVEPLPIVPKEKIRKYINSKIIYRKDELRLLKDTISKNNRKLHIFFDLLYRASDDGQEEKKIKDIIEDHFETLTLFHTMEGARFGVYLKKEECNFFLKGKYYREIPGSCFIVGLNKLRIFHIYPNKTSNNYFKDVLCFGRTFLYNKNKTNWIIYTPKNKFLNEKCIIGNGLELFPEFNYRKIVGNEEYHIKEVEIFNVAIEIFNKEKK